MKIDKWLDDKDTVEEKKKREEIYKNLSKEETKDLKQKKIRNLVQKDKQPDNLSDKQKRALEIAINNGYYNVPRRVTIAKLVKIMGISFSTYQVHIRKQEEKIIPQSYDKL